MELLVWGSFLEKGGVVQGRAGAQVRSQTQVPSPLGLFCAFLFFHIASSVLLHCSSLRKRDFAEMNGAGHFHLSTPAPGSANKGLSFQLQRGHSEPEEESCPLWSQASQLLKAKVGGCLNLAKQVPSA